MRFELLLHRQNVLDAVKCIDDVLVTAGDCKERTGVSHDDERHAVVEYIEQVLVLNLSHAHEHSSTTDKVLGWLSKV